MKVADFMQQSPVAIAEDRPIRDAVRLIFNLGVSAVLITKDKKLIGVVTEEDILHHLFPSVREFMEDYVNARDYDAIEKRMGDLLSKPVRTIMTKNVTTITPDMPIMRAQSLLLLNKFSHLPVVDARNKLVGIISQGDIFRAITSEEIPYETDEEYHDWLAGHYDLVMRKKQRINSEIDSLSTIFQKQGVKRIVDVGCGTGSHAIALAKKGFEVVGMEKSKRMYKASARKYEELINGEKNRVVFVHGESYRAILKQRNQFFDVAILMGNAAAHIPDHYQDVLGGVERYLDQKKGMMVLHLVNTERVLNQTKRLQDFNVSPSNFSNKREYAFVEFYDPPRENEKTLTLTMGILQYNGKRWMATGANSTRLAYIKPAEIIQFVRSLRFNSIELFGSQYGEALFDRKFDPERDPWYTVVARR